ncbi:MAG: mucoidy inhibitor MuiA family protein [Planctomycetota bacterium]|jgi:hypothetical protein
MIGKMMGMLVVLVGSFSAVGAAEAVEVAGKVDAVTVYRGQAVVTRLIELAGPAGLREVVVSDLPEHVVPGSIHAESADGVEVRSVRYRVRPVRQDVREEVRKLDEQIRQVQDELQANERHRQLIAEQKAYLAKLEQFVAATANVELTKGVLNAETLKDLSSFQYEQRTQLTEEELKLQLQQRDLTEKQELLQRKRNEITGSSSRTAREAVVFVNLRGADGGQLRLRYLVERATWSPSYNIRSGGDGQQVLVEYNASIQQMSGEDWTDVSMTLSTATPTLVAKAPVLTPMKIALAPISTEQAGTGVMSMSRYEEERIKLMEQKKQADQKRRSRPKSASKKPRKGAGQQVDLFFADAISGGSLTVQADIELNQLANEIQSLDFMNLESIKRNQSPSRPKVNEGITVTYSLASRTSLPSRSDRQLIQIASLPMKGQFYKVASPVLTNYVYEEASVSNASNMVLLAGPVSTYLADQFVGHGAIPTVAVGEKFTVGFGIDSSLRATRELVEKDEDVQGGNRIVKFTYRLALENFGSDAAVVRLLDRLPQAKETDIKLTLVSPGRELSEDPDYRHNGHKKGILRWEIEVPTDAVGPEAASIEYQFRLEYDKQMAVTGLALAG